MTEKKKEEEGFVSPWDEIGRELYEQLSTRPAFSYDAASDPLAATYREQYVADGKRAMQDTVGRAAALTGGYASTWAQSAGQQAYDASLSRMNDVIPELYALAQDRYEQEGDALLDRLALAGKLSDRDYDRHRDEVEDARYETERAEKAEKEEQATTERENAACEKHPLWPDGVRAEDVEIADGTWRGAVYDDAVATLIKAGAPDAVIEGLLTSSAWNNARHAYLRTGEGDEAVSAYKTYDEYLSAYVTKALNG